MSRRIAVFAFFFATMAAVPEARADAIDGHWCFTDGRSFSINGPSIVTPGGQSITGNYDRHGFAYTVPPKEPSAGAQVMMDLLDDDHVSVRVADGKPDIWKRCARPSS